MAKFSRHQICQIRRRKKKLADMFCPLLDIFCVISPSCCSTYKYSLALKNVPFKFKDFPRSCSQISIKQIPSYSRKEVCMFRKLETFKNIDPFLACQKCTWTMPVVKHIKLQMVHEMRLQPTTTTRAVK